jgi:hypothetical protein
MVYNILVPRNLEHFTDKTFLERSITMLDAKTRIELLTNLGVRNVKGLRADREKYKVGSGYTRTPEVQAKMTAGLKGIINHATRIRCKETEQLFDSQRDAVRHFGGSTTNLCDHLKGRRPSFMGHTFEYV